MEMPNKDLAAFEKVVLAGMRIMFNEKTFKIFMNGMMKEDVPLPKRLAMETAGLMKMIVDKSGGKVPIQIIAPAAVMLLMEMGKFIAEAEIAKPTPQDIQQGTVLLVKILESMYAKKQPAPGQPPQGAQPPAPGQAPQGQPPMPQGQPAPPQPQPATGLIGA